VEEAAVTDDPLAARLAFAHALIREAGAMAAGYFQRLDSLAVEKKGVRDMLSEADLATERLIRGRLAASFPTDGFLGEESGHSVIDSTSGVWVVDPIDGTQPFISGLPNWCVSIAYVRDGRIEIGLVFDPTGDELFAAHRGRPATLNGRPIRPHAGRTLTDGIVSVGYSPRVEPARILPVLRKLLEQGGMFHRNGSGALSLCYVACGRLLGYVEPHINSWDCLAAIAVIEGAGGRTNDFLAGDALLRGNRIVAGPPAVFDQLAALLEP
jgi:myo-inositol-1(or 4)-monophosphatase